MRKENPPLASNPSTFVPGSRIGEVWEVECVLGRGGMGSVYRCHNIHSKRIRKAIKLLGSEFQGQPQGKDRFLREAEILFTISHPNVVGVGNVQLDTEPAYIEMEYIDGVSLGSLIAAGGSKVELAVVLERAHALADALGHIHENGIFHRDIKPDNILIRKDGVLKLVDFGLAVEQDGRRITQAYQTHFGTVSYCPPEWIRSGPLNPLDWDWYAYGVVLWEMLTHNFAFPLESGTDLRRASLQVMAHKQELAYLDPGSAYDGPMRDLVKRLTALEPAERIRDPLLVKEMLEKVDPTLVLTVPPSSPAPTRVPSPSPNAPVLPPAARPSPPPPAATPLPDPVLQAPTSAGSQLRVLGIAALLMVFGLLAGLGVVGLMIYSQGEEVAGSRAVDLHVTGIDRSWPIALVVAGSGPDRVDGLHFAFRDLPIGPAMVSWAIGDGCEPNTVDAWCATGTHRFEVVAGEQALAHVVPLDPPALQDVTIAIEPGGGFAMLDGRFQSSEPDGQVRFSRVRPGRYGLHVLAGECHVGCVKEACGETCVVAEHALKVPVAGEVAIRHTLKAPAKPEPIVVPAPKPPSAPKTPTRVSAKRFGRWIASNPKWEKQAAISSGRADAAYLRGWTGEAAPSGPAVEVPYNAAKAYCVGRGGLRGVDEEPKTWSNSPMHEWRAGPGGKAMWRRMDGATSSSLNPVKSLKQTGFRCAR